MRRTTMRATPVVWVGVGSGPEARRRRYGGQVPSAGFGGISSGAAPGGISQCSVGANLTRATVAGSARTTARRKAIRRIGHIDSVPRNEDSPGILTLNCPVLPLQGRLVEHPRIGAER